MDNCKQQGLISLNNGIGPCCFYESTILQKILFKFENNKYIDKKLFYTIIEYNDRIFCQYILLHTWRVRCLSLAKEY